MALLLMKSLNFSTLQKILFKESKPIFYGLFCLLAYVLSFFILSLSYQVFLDISKFNKSEDKAKFEYLIINKKINWLDTLKLRSGGFTSEEMNELEALDCIERVASFISNDFNASLSIGGSYFPRYAVDLFFESTNAAMIDLGDKEVLWNWKEGDPYVPILIPHTFFALYNFGFAPSRGLPTLSEEMTGKLNLNIKLSNARNSEEKIGKIVGFSKRINSVLVPKSFMDWANNKYGNIGSPKNATRIMIQYTANQEEALQAYLDQKGFQSNKESKNSSTYMKWIHFFIIAFQILGLFIATLALLLNLLIVRIIISAASNNISSLLLLGYRRNSIFQFYWLVQFLVQGLAFFVLIPILLLMRKYWLEYYNILGMRAEFDYDLTSMIPVAAVILASQMVVYFSIKKQLKS